MHPVIYWGHIGKFKSLLADLLGHKNISTTRMYLRKSSLEQRNLINRIVNW